MIHLTAGGRSESFRRRLTASEGVAEAGLGLVVVELGRDGMAGKCFGRFLRWAGAEGQGLAPLRVRTRGGQGFFPAIGKPLRNGRIFSDPARPSRATIRTAASGERLPPDAADRSGMTLNPLKIAF